MPRRASELLQQWLRSQVDDSGWSWLEERRRLIAAGAPDRTFFPAFSAVPRYTGKADLILSPADIQAAENVRPGWRPQHWSVDQAGRTLLALASPMEDVDAYLRRLDQLFAAADVREQIALYHLLPLLPFPERVIPRAAEGARSSMTAVFNAVALHNPFPADWFDEAAWNQLVLKAVFVDSPLEDIVGLDRRANPPLARMLADYVRERWAAGRTFTPVLWRLVGRFADGATRPLLERARASDDPAHREAAALALAEVSR